MLKYPFGDMPRWLTVAAKRKPNQSKRKTEAIKY